MSRSRAQTSLKETREKEFRQLQGRLVTFTDMGSYTNSILTNREHLEIEAKFHLNIYLNMSSEETK